MHYRREAESSTFFGVKGFLLGKKKLTRQRKLRYLSDLELGLSDRARARARSRSLPVSPGAEEIESQHWSVSAVPQPLPRPASPFADGLNSGDSAEEVLSSSMYIRKETNIDATKSVKSSNDTSKDSSHSLITECSYYNLKVDIPVPSATSSCNSSPAHSPPRDIFHSFYATTQEYKTTSPVRNAVSLNSSPIRSRQHNPPSSRGTTFQLQDKFHKESSAAGLETRNVHPLPLPPVSATKLQSANVNRPSSVKTCEPLIKSQWQKGKLIGRGTFGYVYVATNRETGSLCAMKEVDIIPDDPKSSECIKQLQQEIEFLSQLEHPNIVKYLGSEIIDDHLCIYLEYIHPGSLNKYVRQYCEAITEPVIRNFTRHILNGLVYLHSTNTVHRDIKGANLLVDATGFVKLADFGVAKHLTGQAYDLSMKGSPYWMAPEVMQAALLKDANPDRAFAIDIWSLGCTVIEMMNGKPPWSELEAILKTYLHNFTDAIVARSIPCLLLQTKSSWNGHKPMLYSNSSFPRRELTSTWLFKLKTYGLLRPAAMCKVLNNTPPIPDVLSPEGKDFLQCCFRRNPIERPSAKMLLDHPFMRPPLEYKISVFTHAFSEIKLFDKAINQGDWTKQKTEMKSNSPSRSLSNKNASFKGDTPRQCYAENSNFAVACRHSPPILKSLHSLSQQQLNTSTYNRTLSPNASKYIERGKVKQNACTLLRAHGREVAHV